MGLIQSLFGMLTKQEKPLHVGEVMNLWKALSAFEGGHTLIMGLLNHTADPELKRFMESYLKDFEEPWMKRFKQFMAEEGVPLPPAGTEKPKADEKEIPFGAKFTDPEIADILAAKVMTGTSVTQQALLETLRYDLGSMLVELEVDSYRQAFVLRELMERRGWLKVPPPWRPSKPDD